MIYLFDNQKTLTGEVPAGALLSYDQKMILGGQISATVTASYRADIEDAHYFGSKDIDNENIFWMYRITSATKEDNAITLTGIHLMFDELQGEVVRDVRPSGATPGAALASILAGSNWTVGVTQTTGTASGSYYYQSKLSALYDFAKKWNIEFRPRMTFSNGIITGRYIDLYDQISADYGKRYEYGNNLIKVVAEQTNEGIYTALIGRGKGEETEAGGFGRRITFKDVEWSITNGDPVDKPLGQDYVALPNAVDIYGFREGVIEFSETEDPEILLQETYQALVQTSRPRVEFAATAIELDRVELGEIVGIIRDDLGIRYRTRVFELERNFLNKKIKSFRFGDRIYGSAAERIRRDAEKVEEKLRENQSIMYEALGLITASYWNEDGYNYELKADNEHGLPAGYYSFDRPIDQSPTKVVYMGAGKVLIADSKNAANEWEWRTALTPEGLVGSEIITNSITANKLASDVGQALDLSSNTSIKLQVGGRNYVYDSERELSYSIARTEAIHVEHLRNGDVLTVSFQGKADNVDHIVDVYFRDAVNGGIINRSPDFHLTSEFQRFSYTTTLQDVSVFPNGMDLVIRGSTGADPSNEGKTFTIKETKVERGSHVTDWTPATEDIQSQIEITNDAITSSVSDLNGEISTIKQTTEDLTLSFENQQIGGENLLRESDNIVVGDMYAAAGSNAEYQSQTIGDTLKENVPDGSLVTISFDVETLTGINRLQVYNSNNAGPQGIETRSISNIPAGKSRQHVKTVVFHRAEAEIDRIGNFIEFYSTYGSNQFYRISRIKIELGNVPTDYSLHPEELYVGITKVNKDGISVGRSDETIESVLQYDGLKIMEGQKLIASFNSSGANVPELVAGRIRGDVLNLTDGSQTIAVGDGKDFGTVTEALDSFGNAKNLSDSTTITIEVYGDIYDTIRVMGWTGGGQIIIHFMPDARLNGVFRSYGNDCRVTVRGASSSNYGTIKRAGSLSHPVYSLGDKYLRFYYMNLDGEGATASGFYINEGSMAFIYECDIVNVDHALRVVNGGTLIAYSNRGVCSRYGARAEKGGRMWLKGTVPDGADGPTSIWDGFRITEGTITTAQSLYQAPLTQPVRFSTIIKPTRIYTTAYGETWVVSYYGNTGAQGRWETHANWMVANFDFSDAIYKYRAGGTSPTIEMRLRRRSSSHGYSTGVAPKPYNFTPTGTFNAVPRGGWTNWISMPLGAFPSTGTTLKLYASAVNTDYAIWDACEVRVGVTREV